MSNASTCKRSLVLSGGGARGAYEAGVLAYIFEELPPHLLASQRINILCGTSVGAVHACFLAASAHMPNCNINVLLNVWRHLRLGDLLRLRMRDILRLPWDIRAILQNKHPEEGIFLNTHILHNIVTRDIPWPQIQTNLRSGVLDALTVSATHIASGKTMVFIDRPRGGVPPWTRDQRRLAVGTKIGPMHALASAAIPILFPAIQIDGAYYCDGGLRQNTPLSPALRLGADKVLVVAVGHGHDNEKIIGYHQDGTERYPSPSLLLGKVMNALLLDHLDYDLAQLHGFNRLLGDGAEAFGEDFLPSLSKTTERIRGAGYRHVDTVVIRPSKDLGYMAYEYLQQGVETLTGLEHWLLHQLAKDDSASKADLLSYMLFDGAMSARLIELGKADADAARSQLIEFFS